MTIEPIHVYGLIVAQNLTSATDYLLIASVFSFLILFVISTAMWKQRESFDTTKEEAKKYNKAGAKGLKVSTCLFILIVLLTLPKVFVPSWKDLALIYGVPAAYNGSEVVLNDIGKQYPRVKKLIEAKLDEALGSEVEGE